MNMITTFNGRLRAAKEWRVRPRVSDVGCGMMKRIYNFHDCGIRRYHPGGGSSADAGNDMTRPATDWLLPKPPTKQSGPSQLQEDSGLCSCSRRQNDPWTATCVTSFVVGWMDCHFRQCRKADGYCENRKGRRGAFCRFSKARSEAELSLPKLYCSMKATLYPPRPSLRIASMP